MYMNVADMPKVADIPVRSRNPEFARVVLAVVAAVCVCYKVRPEVLYRQTREVEAVEPRWMAWVFMKLFMPKCTLKEMAAEFGLEDHTTVIHGLKKMRYWIKVQKEEAEMYERMREVIRLDVPDIEKHELDWDVEEWQQRCLALERELKRMKNFLTK
jgi:hypothetical protein